MHRAKLLNRSGWKRLTAFTSSIPAMVLMTVCYQPTIGNAQQGTGSASQVAQRTSAREAASSATTAISSTKTNQQPQHRVSVAPQGGELEKKTGADSLEKRIELYDSSFAKTNYSWHYYTMREFAGIKSCHVGDIAIVGGQLLNCVAWDTWREWPTTAFYCPEACDRPPWQIPVPKELITPRE